MTNVIQFPNRMKNITSGYTFYHTDILRVVETGPDDMGDYRVAWIDPSTGKQVCSSFWSRKDIEEGTATAHRIGE